MPVVVIGQGILYILLKYAALTLYAASCTMETVGHIGVCYITPDSRLTSS